MTLSTRDQERLAARAARAACQAGRWAAAGLTAVAGVEVLVHGMPLWASTTGLVGTVAVGRAAARRAKRSGRIRPDVDALEAVREDSARCGGGAFVGLDSELGGVVHAPAECAALVLAPPRAGKTSGVIIPTVLSACGPVLTTSTKPDVLMATARARSLLGTIYLFDPTGHACDGLPDGVVPLRWSPLDAAGTWESARRLAHAMVGASPAAKGTRHESHWTSRAAALLGPLLYAAALDRRGMRDVVSWVLAGTIGHADAILMDAAVAGNPDAMLAREVLEGVERAATEERQSIWSATSDVIDVYTTAEALQAASRSNFDPAEFVRSCDTVYIAAAAEQQASVAPLVVALIEAVRDAQYRRHRAAVIAGEHPGRPVSLVLDEVANVAPIASLPALVSEAGGQSLHVVAALQDLSQVRGRWGSEVADGFLSLFQHVLVLGGIRDTRTLEALSLICGEWDRPQMSRSRSISRARKPGQWRRERSKSWSTSSSFTRQRRLGPGEIYGLEQGQALYLSGSGWRFVRIAAHSAHPRWRAALASAPAEIVVWPPHNLATAPEVGHLALDTALTIGRPGGGRANRLVADPRARGSNGGRRL